MAIANRVIGAASCVACLTVIITFFAEKRLHIKLFPCVLVNVAVAQFLGVVGATFGEAANATPLCTAQAFLGASTAFILFKIFRDEVKNLKIWYFIYFNWLCPLFLTLLPLAFGLKFGRPEGQVGGCFLRNRENGQSWELTFWKAMSFYAWVFVAILLMIGFGVDVLFQIDRRSQFKRSILSSRDKSIDTALDTLRWYPIWYTLCWTPSLVNRFYLDLHLGHTWESWSYYVIGIPVSCLGFLQTIIFYKKTREAREFWSGLYKHMCSCCVQVDDDKKRLHNTDSSSDDSGGRKSTVVVEMTPDNGEDDSSLRERLNSLGVVVYEYG